MDFGFKRLIGCFPQPTCWHPSLVPGTKLAATSRLGFYCHSKFWQSQNVLPLQRVLMVKISKVFRCVAPLRVGYLAQHSNAGLLYPVGRVGGPCLSVGTACLNFPILFLDMSGIYLRTFQFVIVSFQLLTPGVLSDVT